MFRNEFTAKIGFTRVLDRTCGNCGGLYSSNEKSHCPKCNNPLHIPTRPSDTGPRPYCFTEVTLYPMMRQEMKDKHAKRTTASKGLLYTLRMTVWGTYDKERDIVLPDKRTQYLVPKRTIRVLFNNPPTLIPFTANDKSQKVEMKFTFDGHSGDQIEFLDAKQTADASMAGAEPPTPEPTKAPVPNAAVLQQQIADLLQVFQTVGNVLPAPDPEDKGVTLTDASDYAPSEEVVAQEVNTDPFA